MRSGACWIGAVLFAAACGAGPERGLTVSDAVAGEARSGADVAVYFRIESGGEDAIVGAVSPESDIATLHEMQEVDGGGIMMPSGRITVRDGTTTLQPDRSHVMLSGLHRELVAGDRIELTLEFDRHPPIVVTVDVVPLYELAELVEPDE